jgi:hypothetical protein
MPFLFFANRRLSGPSLTISSNTENYNLSNVLQGSFDWNGIDPIDATVIINSGVTVFSQVINVPAFTAHLVTGSNFTLINNGSIIGRGGQGGVGGSNSGGNGGAAEDGGDAISLENISASVRNNSGATIAGGGGGGGGGGGFRSCATFDTEDDTCSNCTNLAGGAGGAGASTDNPPTNSATSGSSGAASTGGTGGTWGNVGNGGSGGTGPGGNVNCRVIGSGGSGGLAGKAVRLNSGATVNVTNNGSVFGATS